jgi:hypothetical protein
VRFLQGCLIFLALDLVLLLALAGAAAYFLTRTPASVRELPPPVISPVKALALQNRLDEFSRELEQASAAGERKRMSLVITEEEANSLIARELPTLQEKNPWTLPFRLESAKVSFRDGKVLAAAVVDLGGLHPQLAVVARVGAQGGRPEVEIEVIELGRLPLLGLVQNYVQQGVQAVETEDIPLEIDRVEVADGQLILEGWSKPQPR